MGQYWYVVNLNKQEYIHPHRLGSGLKLWEQLANHPGVGEALIILCAAQPEMRGIGDLRMGEECDDLAYREVVARTIGRWAGDRIAIVGDYAEDSDLPDCPIPASEIYTLCKNDNTWRNISDDVATVIEDELHGKYIGSSGSWLEWESTNRPCDQYGNFIPSDLALLPKYRDLTEVEQQVVFDAIWYEAKNTLMASCSEIQGLSENDPADAAINVQKDKTYRVDDALKRGNANDGFYHA